MTLKGASVVGGLFLLTAMASGVLNSARAEDEFSLQRSLRAAIEAGDEEAAVLAIDQGAEPIRKLFDLAVSNGWISMVEALLDLGQWEGGKGALVPLVKAVQAGDEPMVWVLLERGAPMNEAWRRESVLEMAIREGHTRIALMLIDKGADFLSRDHHALRLAARHGEAAVALRLMERGSDLNDLPDNLEATRYNGTPLMEAAKAGHLSIVRRLLQQGAARTPRNGRGDTAYTLAKMSAERHPEDKALMQIVELLQP